MSSYDKTGEDCNILDFRIFDLYELHFAESNMGNFYTKDYFS